MEQAFAAIESQPAGTASPIARNLSGPGCNGRGRVTADCLYKATPSQPGGERQVPAPPLMSANPAVALQLES